ncbi:MAG TPA: hypothetical protein VG408_06910 [Actinomycetota bacterium]|nr:hypothetical protein [Actinomycetota bacterium]
MGETTATRHSFGDLLRRLRPRPRVRAERQSPVVAPEHDTDTADAAPTAYRTFSPKLAPGLTAIGGALALAGGLGTWIRATKLVTEGFASEEAAVTMGYEDWPGIAIAVLGGLAVLASVTWLMSLLLVKVLPVAYSVGIAALVAWQMPLINDRAAALAASAQQELDFIAFHAGYGWGVWCMLAGAIALLLATTAGILREIDIRRGIPT